MLDPVKALFSDLRSPDPAIRFSVLSRAEGMQWTPEQIAAFRDRISGEKDSGTRFHMQKILVRVEKGKGAVGMGKIAETLAIIQTTPPDDFGIALSLEAVARSEGPLVVKALREAKWPEFSARVLPFVLQFFKKYGAAEDAPGIEALCHHPDPRVLSAAVEALEKLHPDSLKPLMVPLLVSPIHGIRSRAVRLLYRWDPEEALRHFEAMLFANDSGERQAALFHSFFLPFEAIIPLMLRFLSMESDPATLEKAGYLFRANPLPEVMFRLIEILEGSRDEKRKIIGLILSGVIQSLSQAGIIDQTPEQIMAGLKEEYRRRKATQVLERCKLALASPNPQHRKAAVSKLYELLRAGFTEAQNLLVGHGEKETDAEVKELLGSQETPLAVHPPPAQNDFEQLSSEVRLRLLTSMDEISYESFRENLKVFFPRMSASEKSAFLRSLTRIAGTGEQEYFLESLNDAEAEVVVAAMEGLRTLNPEALFPTLSRLLGHESGEVRAVALRVFTLFDKKQALEMIEEMLLSVQADRRGLAIQCASQLDFPSVRKMLLQSLENEVDANNLQYLRAVFKDNIDKDLVVDLVRVRQAHARSAELQGFLDALIQQFAKIIVNQGKTSFKDVGALLGSIERKLADDQKKKSEEYSLDRIQKSRGKLVSKPRVTDPIEALSIDLRSSDPAMRFSVLSRVESIEWTADRVEAFRKLADQEKDGGTRFHMRKILTHITRDKEASKPGQSLQIELQEQLKKTPLDEMSLALLLESVSRKEGTAILELLRQTEWQKFSSGLMPFLLQFFKKFGKPEDVPGIEKLLQHQDARVLVATIETLEKLNPDSLKAQIVPLLVSPHQGIRSRAIRLLHRWDSREALKHFEAALFSDDPIDRQGALFQAFFFPFHEIEPLLLRFLGIEESQAVLEKAGYLFRINPTPEAPLRLIDVMEASHGEKRQVIGEILNGVVQSLSQAGLIQASPDEIMADLQKTYRETKIGGFIERCRIALNSGDAENRKAAITRLGELGKAGLAIANDVLTSHLAGESDAELKKLVESHLGQVKTAAPDLTEIRLETASSQEKIQCFNGLTREILARIRPGLAGVMRKAPPEEKRALLLGLHRVGEKQDAALVQGFLNDPEPVVLAAAIEALGQIDPDVLFPFLPKLIQHSSDDVKVAALQVFSLFDKKQTLALIEKMLSAHLPKQRGQAIFCAGHFDFPSVRGFLLKALPREADLDNFRQIAAMLKSHLDEEVYIGIVAAQKSVSDARVDIIESFARESEKELVRSKKTSYSTVEELRKAVEKRLEDEEKQARSAQPSYTLSNIQKLRQEQTASVLPKIDPELVRFTVVAFAVGAVLTALIWFVILAPGPRPKRKGPKPVKGQVKPPNDNDPTDIQGSIESVDPNGKGILVKHANGKKYHILLKNAPPKPFEKGKHFRGQVQPGKVQGDLIESELLMIY